MRIEDLRDDRKYVPTREAWAEYCAEDGVERPYPPPPQAVDRVGSHPPYGGLVMLAFPMRWWDPAGLGEAG